jgi:Mitochondrial K+-H+ exchange-related
VKIYLLLIDHSRFFFYSDETEASLDEGGGNNSPTSSRSGMRGWLVARYDRFKLAWDKADSGALVWMRRSWDWLHSWAHPDETMLARLWSARRVELYHPAARPGSEVLDIWKDYLSRQWRRHLVWLSFNGIIAPFAFWLFILPGPNLIGYWFAYRTIHHLVVVWGIRRVRRNKVSTELHPIAALDLPIERDADGKIGHAALTGAAARLDEHVTWHSSARGAPADGMLPDAPVPPKTQRADSQTEKP